MNLFKLGKRFNFIFLLAMCSALLLAAFEFFFALSLQVFLISSGFMHGNASYLEAFQGLKISSSVVGLVLIFMGIFRGCAQFLVSQSTIFMRDTAIGQLSLLALGKVFTCKDLAPAVPSSEMGKQIGEIFPRVGEFVENTAKAVILGVQIIALLGMMFFFSWKAAVLSVCTLACISFVLSRLQRKTRRLSAQSIDHYSDLFQSIQRVIRNWLLVRVFRVSKFEQQRMNENIISNISHDLKIGAMANLAAATPSVLGITFLVLIVFINDHIIFTPGLKFVAFLYVFLRFIQSTHGFLYNYGMLNSKTNYYKEALRFLGPIDKSEQQHAISSSIRI